jgi:hypothetical protein
MEIVKSGEWTRLFSYGCFVANIRRILKPFQDSITSKQYVKIQSVKSLHIVRWNTETHPVGKMLEHSVLNQVVCIVAIGF